ncbi:MAG: GTPase ObgE [Parcubacteria group bacterium]|nr:GTPase ObgE [Parcubacteria group bacterium]
MLIDDVTIRVKAGKGGDGKVAFNKNLMSLGPTGADGGKGGSVYFEGVSDINALSQFRNKKEVQAGDGGQGKAQYNDGADGQDLVLKIPVGTVIHNLDTGRENEIVKIGERILLTHGGRGGKGNFKFRSAVNTSPRQFTQGMSGEAFTVRLELKLIADVGFVGLPNVGKSSLLNALTRASAKVANYPFTTLEPNLGVYYELVLADIPGLVEGASTGKGLGVKFLRHIERTRILFHFISAESSDPLGDYKTIKNELAVYNPDLANKKEYLFLSKSDVVTPEEVDKQLNVIKKINKESLAISILDEESLGKIKKILNEIKADK